MKREEAIFNLTQLYKISEGPKLVKLIQDYSTFDIMWILSVLQERGPDTRLVHLEYNPESHVIDLSLENIATNEKEVVMLIISIRKSV